MPKYYETTDTLIQFIYENTKKIIFLLKIRIIATLILVFSTKMQMCSSYTTIII